MNLNITLSGRVEFFHHVDGGLPANILAKLEQIMSAISDFATKVKAHQDQEDAAIAGLTQDVQTLNDKITALQNSAGQITPEDQLLLDEIVSRGQTISSKLAALDAMTPPPAPTL